MSEIYPKSLCAHVEEGLQIKDPQAYIALIQPAHTIVRDVVVVRQKLRLFVSPGRYHKSPHLLLILFHVISVPYGLVFCNTSSCKVLTPRWFSIFTGIFQKR